MNKNDFISNSFIACKFILELKGVPEKIHEPVKSNIPYEMKKL